MGFARMLPEICIRQIAGAAGTIVDDDARYSGKRLQILLDHPRLAISGAARS